MLYNKYFTIIKIVKSEACRQVRNNKKISMKSQKDERYFILIIL